MHRGLVVAILALLPAVAVAAAGDLDPTFGDAGIVLQSDIGVNSVSGLVLQPNGRLIVAASRLPDEVLFLVAYGPDGRLDPRFGTNGNGWVTVSGEFTPSVLADPDGSLLVASTRCDATGCVGALRRYTADGRVDPTFSAPDRLLVVPTEADTIARQPDGKILVGGDDGHAPGFGVWLARYNADGTNDETFGTAGIASEAFVSSHGASIDSILVLPDGSFLASVTGGTGEGTFASVPGYTTSGQVAFGLPGFGIDFGYPLLAHAPDGGVIVAATHAGAGTPGRQIRAFRYDATLQPAATFPGAGPAGFAHDVVVAPDGRTVVAAGVDDAAGFTHFGIVRFTADGAVDTAFGNAGTAAVFPQSVGEAYRVFRQPDGKLVAAGTLGGPLLVARFLDEDAAPPTTTTVPSTTTTTGAATTTTTVPSAGTLPGSTTTTTTRPVASCTTDADCDDGDACTVDTCAAGTCSSSAALGFAAVTCLCVPAPSACDTASPALGARLARACTLIARAGDSGMVRARRLLRRAIHVLRADRRTMAHLLPAASECAAAVGDEIDGLETGARGLLNKLRR